MAKKQTEHWKPWILKDWRNLTIWLVLMAIGITWTQGGFDTMLVKIGLPNFDQCYTSPNGQVVCCGRLSPTRGDPLCDKNNPEGKDSETQIRLGVDRDPSVCEAAEWLYPGTDAAMAQEEAIIIDECRKLGLIE